MDQKKKKKKNNRKANFPPSLLQSKTKLTFQTSKTSHHQSLSLVLDKEAAIAEEEEGAPAVALLPLPLPLPIFPCLTAAVPIAPECLLLTLLLSAIVEKSSQKSL